MTPEVFNILTDQIYFTEVEIYFCLAYEMDSVDFRVIHDWALGRVPIPDNVAAQLLKLNTLYRIDAVCLFDRIPVDRTEPVRLWTYTNADDFQQQDPLACAIFNRNRVYHEFFISYMKKKLELQGYTCTSEAFVAEKIREILRQNKSKRSPSPLMLACIKANQNVRPTTPEEEEAHKQKMNKIGQTIWSKRTRLRNYHRIKNAALREQITREDQSSSCQRLIEKLRAITEPLSGG